MPKRRKSRRPKQRGRGLKRYRPPRRQRGGFYLDGLRNYKQRGGFIGYLNPNNYKKGGMYEWLGGH